MVNSTSPVNNATGIASTANVSATFSEDMDQSTLTTSTFTLTKRGSTSPLAATVSYDSANKRATLDPASDLETNTSYTARVTGGSSGAKDQTGNPLVQDHSWTFTTATPPAPTCTKRGTSGNDVLDGTPGNDVICGGGGSDTVRGLGGNDVLRGEAGNVKLFGDETDDTVNSMDSVNGNDSLDGGAGTDTKVTDATEKSIVRFP